MGCLRSIEKEVDHAQRVNDSASPRSGLALAQRRGTFPAEGCCQLTAEGCILVIQVIVAEGISQLSDLVEALLHVFGYLLRRTAFGHNYFHLLIDMIQDPHSLMLSYLSRREGRYRRKQSVLMLIMRCCASL